MASSHWLSLTRTIVFGVVTVFSIIVLGLAAHTISSTTSSAEFYFTFDAFAVAVSVLTWTTLPAMWIIDRMRRGAVTSLILVELIWLGILWVLWLASAALSASNISGADCNLDDYFFVPSWFTTGCGESKAVTAFGWLIWFALSAYLVSLLVLSIASQNKGAPVWKSTVNEATFAPANVDLHGAMGTSREPKTAMAQQQQQQQHVAPQSYPPQSVYSSAPTV